MTKSNIFQLLEHLDDIKPEERAEVLKTHLAQAWDDGLYFAGDAVRGGCSLTEAATANPYRKPESTAHVSEAFEALQRHEPEWERGFLQHTLMVALNTPGIATDTALPQALVLVPAQLRKQTYDAPSDVHALILRLVKLAEKDEDFLQNFLDGKPCAPFM